MKGRKLLCTVLAVLLLVSISVPAVADNGADAETPQYTNVFIHGLMGWGYNDAISDVACYWGMLNGNMVDYLCQQDYPSVNASVGPLSSCWDRCCELYAQLTGTVTDYGAAHSAQCEASFANAGNDLKHERYGRDYTGGAIVDNWGPIYENGKVTGWYDNKLNLIGHSFGGPTATMFLYLLEEGDENEIAWGKEQAAIYGGDWHDYVSPLFWGDYNGRYLINSVTSLAGVLNGTTFLSTCKTSSELLSGFISVVANSLGLTDIAYLYDFQLEHFGITKQPGAQISDDEFFSTLKQKGFLEGYDNAFYDLSVQGANELKQGWVTYDNVYYFAFAGDKTWESPVTGYSNPDIDITIIFALWSFDMGHDDYSFEQVKDIYGNYVMNTDKYWMPNDGMVNTISARYPIGAANKPYDAENIEAGVWQWRDEDFDHGKFITRMRPFDTAGCKDYYMSLMRNIDAGCANAAEKGIDGQAGWADRELPFRDVNESFWAYDDIKELYEAGAVNGVSPDMFCPNGLVTRGQFVKMLALMDGADISSYENCAFTDVPDDSYYAPCIAWAADNGIVTGYSDEIFAPDKTITREELAVILCRYADFAGIELPVIYSECSFTDDAAISGYAYNAVKTLQMAGIILGYDNADGTVSFRPQGNATRAEACALLCRICNQ